MSRHRGSDFADHDAGVLRPEIARSWHRSVACGLHPEDPLDSPELVPFDNESRLARAAGPVLTRLAQDLEGTRYALMLADRAACIVDRRFSDPRLEHELDGIGAVVGSRFSEETTGTNAIATALEVQSGIVVRGPEHFMLPMKRFSCYGQPVRHPVSRRIEAVLQITGPLGDENALWAPVINRAATDIAARMLDGTRLEERRTLAAFQEANYRTDALVVALSDQLFLCNPAAVAVLDPADHGLLRDIAEDTTTDSGVRRAITLTAGIELDVRARRIPDAPGAVLLEMTKEQARNRPVPRRPGASWASRTAEDFQRYRTARTRLLIAGEPGSGRTTAAETLAGSEPLVRLDSADVAGTGRQPWMDRLAAALDRHEGLVVIDDIDTMPSSIAARAARLLRDSSAWFALTIGPATDLKAGHAEMAALCETRCEIPPLRYRRDELPQLIRTMTDRLDPDAGTRFSGSALDALRGAPWPANLRELDIVLRHTMRRRRGSRMIGIEDLPAAYQLPRKAHRLTPLEQAEHDAIVRTLHETGGNKVHAARALGISRTTLYNRLRHLGIDR